LALDETGSTNADCLEWANKGDPGKLWITAQHQTAGRGSRGRDWQSKAGNLFASLLLLNPGQGGDVNQLSNLTFVASLGLYSAISRFRGHAEARLELKWPNDVLLDGNKCAGILLENQQVAGNTAVIIGFGVNCCHHPKETNFPATDLCEQGISVHSQDLFAALVEELHGVLEIWDHGSGFSAIRDMWLQKARGVGADIIVRIPNQPDQTGKFVTIDDDGLLVLRG